MSKEIHLHLSTSKNTRVFRNNVGVGVTGKFELRDGNAFVKNARVVRFGLAVGSADFIGITAVEITPDMVGQRIGVFTSIEVKDGGRNQKEQQNWLEFVRMFGGIAGVAHSPEEAEDIITRGIRDKEAVGAAR